MAHFWTSVPLNPRHTYPVIISQRKYYTRAPYRKNGQEACSVRLWHWYWCCGRLAWFIWRGRQYQWYEQRYVLQFLRNCLYFVLHISTNLYHRPICWYDRHSPSPKAARQKQYQGYLVHPWPFLGDFSGGMRHDQRCRPWNWSARILSREPCWYDHWPTTRCAGQML